MTSKERSQKNVIPGYEILKKIGQGGMGAVYMARQKSMDRIVALKILPRSMARQSDFKVRFFREARAAGKLNHPNIVTAIDAQEAGGYCYIAMEYVEGESVLAKLLREGAIAEAESLDIVDQVAAGLNHAWEAGIIHRDVKPENILYTDNKTAKLCDLGIAKAPADSDLTQTGTALGTPKYISPEQARGQPDIDFRADIYSLGASLYHMLAGAPPFDGPTSPAIMIKHLREPLPPLRERAPNVSANCAALVERMMAKEPDKRYDTPLAFLTDLDAVRKGRVPPVAGKKRFSRRRTATRRSVTGERTAIRARYQNRTVAMVVGAILVAIILVVITWPGDDPDSRGNGPPPPPPRLSQEEKARKAFRQAEALEKNGDLSKALDEYARISLNWPQTGSGKHAAAKLAYALAVKLERQKRVPQAYQAYRKVAESWPQTATGIRAGRDARRLQKSIAANKRRREQQRREQRQQQAARELGVLHRQKPNLPIENYIARLYAFCSTYKGTPSERQARQEAQRLQTELERTPRPKPPPEAGKIKAPLIAKLRTKLRETNWAQIDEILKVIEKKGKEGKGNPLKTLTAEISNLCRTAGRARTRRLALQALAATNPGAAPPVALRQLTDRNEQVRLAAIGYLQDAKVSAAREKLKRLVTKDPSPRVRQAGKQALAALGE